MSDNTVNTNLYQASSDTQTTSANYMNSSAQVAGTPFYDNRPSLHIALVTETWLPDINGVASSVYQIMRELKSMGHRITLIRPKQSDEVEQHTLTTGLTPRLLPLIYKCQVCPFLIIRICAWGYLVTDF